MGLPFNKIETYLGVKVRGSRKKAGRGTGRFVIDSRCLRKGDVFIAIRGENHDAHDFIDKTLREKAALCIVNEAWFRRHRPVTGAFVPVKDTVLAMLKMAESYRWDLGLKVVAVTGSNGKTTTRAMIARVLSGKYRVFETGGNFNNRIGLPLSVFQLTRCHQIAVLEMGTNHFGEIEELSSTVHPDLAVITNVGRGHLEFLRDRRGVLKAKMEILDGMSEGGRLVVNGDDPLLRACKLRQGIRKITAGFKGKQNVKAGGFKTGILSGTTFRAAGQPFRLNIPGRGAAQDALLALAVGRAFGVPMRSAARALRKVKVPSDRMSVRRVNGATLIADCYNANPDSLGNVLELLRDEKVRGRKIAVLGTMGELGKKSVCFHREAGALVKACGFDVLLTFGKLGAEIARGARDSGLKECFSFEDKKKLITIIKKSVRRGDLVLIKGSHSTHLEEVERSLTGDAAS